MHCQILKALVQSSLAEIYLRDMNALDVKRVTEMHELITGIEGILGGLDCMHAIWKNCPYPLQGVNKGGTKKPSLILEEWQTTTYGSGT